MQVSRGPMNYGDYLLTCLFLTEPQGQHWPTEATHSVQNILLRVSRDSFGDPNGILLGAAVSDPHRYSRER